MNMNYWKDAAGAVHALSDEDVANGGEKYLPVGCVSITATDANAILNPPLTQAQLNQQASDQAKASLIALDLASIRDLRAWVAAQPTAPQTLKDRETAAIALRAKVI